MQKNLFLTGLYSRQVSNKAIFYVLLKRIVDSKMPPKTYPRNSRRPKQAPAKKDPEPPKLVVLKYGRDNNFPVWKEAIRNEVAIEYGLLVSIIDDGELIHPTEVNVDGSCPQT